MKNSINNLRNQLSNSEILSINELSAVKGGAGEDLRKMMSTTTIVSTAIKARAL
jgi:bacteriocin-like protein